MAAGGDRDELGHEMGFVDVQAAAGRIGESPGSDFSGAGMIDELGSPSGFDAITCGSDAAARLTGNDYFL